MQMHVYRIDEMWFVFSQSLISPRPCYSPYFLIDCMNLRSITCIIWVLNSRLGLSFQVLSLPYFLYSFVCLSCLNTCPNNWKFFLIIPLENCSRHQPTSHLLFISLTANIVWQLRTLVKLIIIINDKNY